MRLKDAIGSLQLGRKKESVVHRLCTEWSESADDGPGAVPLAEYPRPQFRRRDWQCLNGWWEYRILPAGKAAEGLSREADGKQTEKFWFLFLQRLPAQVWSEPSSPGRNSGTGKRSGI